MIRVGQFIKSLAEFVADGCKTVTPEQYKSRLQICDKCVDRSGHQCGFCRCVLAVKAKGRVWDCPHPHGSKWPNLENSLAESDPPRE